MAVGGRAISVAERGVGELEKATLVGASRCTEPTAITYILAERVNDDAVALDGEAVGISVVCKKLGVDDFLGGACLT